MPRPQATRWQGNADLRSAPPRAAGRATQCRLSTSDPPARERRPPVGTAPRSGASDAVPIDHKRPAGKGTPTSAAPPRAAGRATQCSVSPSDALARERRPPVGTARRRRAEARNPAGTQARGPLTLTRIVGRLGPRARSEAPGVGSLDPADHRSATFRSAVIPARRSFTSARTPASASASSSGRTRYRRP